MTAHAPVHPGTAQGRGKPAEAHHELLDDVMGGDEGSSKSQRVIAWVCVLLTAAAVLAAWRLF